MGSASTFSAPARFAAESESSGPASRGGQDAAAYGRLDGVVTDGDVRRAIAATPDILALTAAAIMGRAPVTVGPGMLAAEALHTLEQRKITAVVVVDAGRRALGGVHLHDLWRTGLV